MFKKGLQGYMQQTYLGLIFFLFNFLIESKITSLVKILSPERFFDHLINMLAPTSLIKLKLMSYKK